jgi:hypothetical protein
MRDKLMYSSGDWRHDVRVPLMPGPCLDRLSSHRKRQQVYAECFGKVRERSALVAAREVELGHALEAIRRDGQSVISGGIGGDGEDGFEDEEVQEGKDGE